MRVLIVSDIHANLAALDAVLTDAGQVDAVWNTGDCVGYGPQPGECIARMQETGAIWVAGNHERAATGAIDTNDFNPQAAAAAQWTRAHLSDEERAALDALPEVHKPDTATLVHGTLRWPIWEYLTDYESARGHLALMTTPVGFVGHTHVPAVVRENTTSPEGCTIDRLRDGDVTALGETKTVFNPGSVGQPRDGDPRASYGIYDSDEGTFTLHRVLYEVAATQRLMESEGLPVWLIERLEIGR